MSLNRAVVQQSGHAALFNKTVSAPNAVTLESTQSLRLQRTSESTAKSTHAKGATLTGRMANETLRSLSDWAANGLFSIDAATANQGLSAYRIELDGP